MSSPLATPLRADAARNRERVLRAATQVFNDDGIDAGVEQIAHRAGVGIGTLYRRFPTKEALIEHLVDELIATMQDAATESLGLADGRGLETHLRRMAELFAANRGCLPRLWARRNPEQQRDHRARLQRLLTAAIDARAVRPDTTLPDVLAVLWALRGIIDSAGDDAADLCRRHLDLVFIGLRASMAP